MVAPLHVVPSVTIAAGQAHTAALDLFARGERLDYYSAWVFTRHLQRGVSSPVAFFSAASRRTRRIGLGAAVIALEYERLLTLAEGLSTADILSGGRLEAGVSTHAPRLGDDGNAAVFGEGRASERGLLLRAHRAAALALRRRRARRRRRRGAVVGSPRA